MKSIEFKRTVSADGQIAVPAEDTAREDGIIWQYMEIYQDKHLRNLTCKRVQCDEIWSYVGAKDKNVPAEKQGNNILR